jgi:hypothetical protein
MMGFAENLPGTGRGAIRRVVEGHVRGCAASKAQENCNVPLHPSASRCGPPPRAGEVL